MRPLDRELVTAAQAAGLEYIAAAGGCHAGSKAVYAGPAPDLGLIGSLGHPVLTIARGPLCAAHRFKIALA